jgi:hypothetical protein
MWCANAWVGAPWACGEARYDESVENYEHDVTKSYAVIRENYPCDRDNKIDKCGDINWGKGKNAKKNKKLCKNSYTFDSSDKVYRPCETHEGKCKMNSTDSCPTSSPTSSSSSPTGDISCNELVSVFPSACEGGCTVMSTNMYPWIEDDILYGYVAQDYGSSSTDTGCTTGMGAVYELTFSSGKTAYVQVINCGNIISANKSSGINNAILDFLIPGGGVGEYDGCENMPGWDYSYITGKSATAGGLYQSASVSDAFPRDQDAQDKVTGILRNSDYFNQSGSDYSGNATLTGISDIIYGSSNTNNAIIEKLAAKSGVIPTSSTAQYVTETSINNSSDATTSSATMTHYWDCCKPNIVSNPPTDGDGDCPLGYYTASIINSDGDAFTGADEGNSTCIYNYNSGDLGGGCCIYSGGTCASDNTANSGGYCGTSASNCSLCNGVNAYFNSTGELQS